MARPQGQTTLATKEAATRIKNRHETPRAAVPGHPGITKQVLLGPADGSDEIVLRYFTATVP